MLAWTIYLAFAGAAWIALFPFSRPRSLRLTALGLAVALGLTALAGALSHPGGSAIVTLAKVPWIPALGIQYHLAADGLSVTLVLLTAIAGVAGVLFSWNVSLRTREFFALYFALLGGVYGVFLSADLFLLFVFYELAIVPKYFLIAIWGSTDKEYGAMKLALYSFVGSAMVLVGLLATYAFAGARTTDLIELSRVTYPLTFQYAVFPLVFVGFAVLAGLWPFHTWAPTGHVAAPTAASMLLAGVIMKLGAYGCLRVAIALYPAGLSEWPRRLAGFGSWQEVFGLLAVTGIIYGALVALTQKDFKFVIGYSSVSHMGFVLLGLVSLNQMGLSGAVLQMFSHGIIAGLLFAVVGRMVYDRTHTRQLGDLSRLNLGRTLPFAGVIFALACLASMGMPGFSGFIAELQVLMGSWHAFPTLAVLAGVGIVVGVAFTLRVLQQSFFADTPPGTATLGFEPEPISVPEKLGAMLLISMTLLIGIYPRLLLDWIVPSFDSLFFEASRKGGLW